MLTLLATRETPSSRIESSECADSSRILILDLLPLNNDLRDTCPLAGVSAFSSSASSRLSASSLSWTALSSFSRASAAALSSALAFAAERGIKSSGLYSDGFLLLFESSIILLMRSRAPGLLAPDRLASEPYLNSPGV